MAGASAVFQLTDGVFDIAIFGVRLGRVSIGVTTGAVRLVGGCGPIGGLRIAGVAACACDGRVVITGVVG